MNQPVFRFAPSPNGELHLGHAYSALLNLDLARKSQAKLLLRIEDIDIQRCTPEFEKKMLEDLEWIGFEWDEPPRRQSENMKDYLNFLETLESANLLFPSKLSRREIRQKISNWEQATGRKWPSDPDGAPVYPGHDKSALDNNADEFPPRHQSHALRLNMHKAASQNARSLYWNETGYGPDGQTGRITANPKAWGDVVIARKEVPTSYHLSCVVDDALQEITHVVRGEDLFHSTSVHRLLQQLLNLPEPVYHHHKLIRDTDGSKLSKSRKDTSLRQLRDSGLDPEDVRALIMKTG